MASLMKISRVPLVIQRCVLNRVYNLNRSISTSENKTSSVTTTEDSKKDKNWVSYGFHYTDQKEDTNVHNASFFFSITLVIMFGGFIWAYAPDGHLRDWAQREAFLELRRREKAGLLPIDPNYVNPKSVQMPTEDEICEVGIII